MELMSRMISGVALYGNGMCFGATIALNAVGYHTVWWVVGVQVSMLATQVAAYLIADRIEA